MPAGSDIPALITFDVALYQALPDLRDEGLVAAHALASALALRRALPWRETILWRLAAELLVPAWAVEGSGAERLAKLHRWAPEWLVRQRRARCAAPAAG